MIGEAVDDLHPVVAVNDSQKPVTIRASVCRDGECLLEKERQLPANGSVNLGRVPAATEPAFYEISWQGEVSGENHYLAGPRPFDVATCRDGYAAISREVGSAR